MIPLRATTGASALGALTIATGLVAGYFGNRWGEPYDLELAAKAVASIPRSFGDWELAAENEMLPEVRSMLQCAGYVNRVYRNTKTQEAVSLALIVGPSGPTSVHTPEICYSSRDYRFLKAPAKWTVPDRDRDSFWDMTLQAKDVNAQLLHIVYAWNAGDGWTAADHPRFSFAAHRKLYKLQMATPIASESQTQGAASHRFLQDLLPVLDATLAEAADAKA